MKQKKIKYLIFNWKSAVDISYLIFFFNKINKLPSSDLNFFIICPSIYLYYVFEKRKHSNISIFAQDFSPTNIKDLIGVTTFSMFKDFCDGALINHWKNEIEYQNSSLALIKLKKVLQNNFKAVLCLNNLKYSLDDIESFFKYLEKKIVFFLNDLTQQQRQKIIFVFEIYPKLIESYSDQKIAYYVEKVLFKIKFFCFIKYQIKIPLLFGTNLNEQNLFHFYKIKSLDGFVFGRESYNRKTFFNILKSFW